MNKRMRYAVFLQLFFKWDGDLYRKHFDAVYKADMTPMGATRNNEEMREAGEIALELTAQKPVTVE